MTLLAALRAYQALDVRQRQLLGTKRLTGDYAPDYWLRLLGGLAAFDAHGDRLRRTSGILLLISLGPLLLSLAAWQWLLIGVPLAGVSGALYLILRRRDLSNRLRGFVLPLTAILSDDLAPGTTLHLALDLRGGTVKDKQVGSRPPYKRGIYHKVQEALFDDPWLSAEAVLWDGSRLHLAMHDRIRRLTKAKRTARGKTKTKTRLKIRGLAEVRLKLPAARRRDAAAPSPEADGKWLLRRGRQITPRPEAELHQPALEPVLALLTRLYSDAPPAPRGDPHAQV